MRTMAFLDMAVDFVNLLLAALLVGALFGIWLSFNPSGLDAMPYILQQQHGIRTLNVVMPALGLTTLLSTMMAAGFARRDPARFIPLLIASVCLLGAGLITRFLNQPINAIMIAWSAASPPADWMDLRDEWWRWHVLRLGFGLVSLSLIIGATMMRTHTGGDPD